MWTFEFVPRTGLSIFVVHNQLDVVGIASDDLVSGRRFLFERRCVIVLVNPQAKVYGMCTHSKIPPLSCGLIDIGVAQQRVLGFRRCSLSRDFRNRMSLPAFATRIDTIVCQQSPVQSIPRQCRLVPAIQIGRCESIDHCCRTCCRLFA